MQTTSQQRSSALTLIEVLDGSVASVTTPGVRELLHRGEDNGTLHYMNP